MLKATFKCIRVVNNTICYKRVISYAFPDYKSLVETVSSWNNKNGDWQYILIEVLSVSKKEYDLLCEEQKVSR